MSKSRKLITAFVLLAGGYGLALLLSSLSDTISPRALSPTGGGSDQGGLWTALQRLVPRGNAPAGGELVPEADFVARATEKPKPQPTPWNDRPTWLSATPVSSSEPLAASKPAAAPGPTITGNWPLEPGPLDSPDSAAALPRPSGRITNVVGVTSELPSDRASPWDRWPRWEPSVTAASSPTTSSPAPSNLPAMEPVESRATQAAFVGAESRSPRPRDEDEGVDSHDSLPGRTHVVVDGDSLEKLADRYLDDPTLDEEIYRFNRDVPSDPEVLPIGVELRIPDNRTANASTYQVSQSPASMSIDAAKPTVPSGMVPVDWAPQALENVPRAQLLRPIPAGRSN